MLFLVSVIPQKFFHKAFIRKMNTRVKIVPWKSFLSKILCLFRAHFKNYKPAVE